MAADAPEAGDPRAASLRAWEEAAPGWVRRQDIVREFGAPVSTWMIDAILPQPGHRVLELAAGLGETGMLAAELVAPIGGVIISDQAEAMLLGARERAEALGLTNVEFQVLNAEWIDLPVASVDAMLCRLQNSLIVRHFLGRRIGEISEQGKIQILVSIGEISDLQLIDQRFDR